jgi:hypothetical protein
MLSRQTQALVPQAPATEGIEPTRASFADHVRSLVASMCQNDNAVDVTLKSGTTVQGFANRVTDEALPNLILTGIHRVPLNSIVQIRFKGAVLVNNDVP